MNILWNIIFNTGFYFSMLYFVFITNYYNDLLSCIILFAIFIFVMNWILKDIKKNNELRG